MTADTCDDGNYLVRVRAQVMSRDDSSGGWVPLGGGGLSNVSVRKRPRPPPTGGGGGAPPPPAPPQDATPPAAAAKPKHDYLIYGRRISDNTVVLSCTIKKDFEYNKVMPTFHHWRTGDRRFGLTFQAAADARAFDKGVRAAVQDLLDGFTDTSPNTPLPKCTKDVGDDDVFMTLDLPQDPKDSRSSSDSSSGKGTEHLHRITYIGGHEKPLEARQPSYDPQKGGENYPYVQLTAVHDYIYPSEGQQKRPPGSRSDAAVTTLSSAPDSKRLPRPPPPLKKGATDGGRRRCRHCNELFDAAHNPRGSCEYAPDWADSAIKAVSCLTCVQCAMYHCASDAEGEFPQHPCDCTPDETCTKRWVSLTLLTLFVPCLWFYPPLRVCHWCGVRCGACGGRHREADI